MLENNRRDLLARRFPIILLAGIFCSLNGTVSRSFGDDDQIKYAIQDCQQHADSDRDTMANLESAYAPEGDLTAGDIAKMDKDYQTAITAWEAAVAAYKTGDAAKGAAARAAAVKAGPAIDWSRRLQYRQRMYYLDLNDRWVLAYASWSTPRAIPALGAWVKAKKKCSVLWNRACESMTDDTDSTRPIPETELAAIDAAKAADIEEETARWDYELAKNIYNDYLRDKDVTSPELTRAIAALTDLEKQRVALRLEDIDREKRARDYERQLVQLEAQAGNAATAARKAHDDAQRAAMNKH
jgi:hypothetical protein